jgi:hypothetical protein
LLLGNHLYRANCDFDPHEPDTFEVPPLGGLVPNVEGVGHEHPALGKSPAPPAIDARPAQAGTPNLCGSWPQLTSILEVVPLHEPAPFGVPPLGGLVPNAEGVGHENPALGKSPAPPAIDARPAQAGTPNLCGSWLQLTSIVEVGPLHEPAQFQVCELRFAIDPEIGIRHSAIETQPQTFP